MTTHTGSVQTFEIVVEVQKLKRLSPEDEKVLGEVAKQRKACFEHGRWD